MGSRLECLAIWQTRFTSSAPQCVSRYYWLPGPSPSAASMFYTKGSDLMKKEKHNIHIAVLTSLQKGISLHGWPAWYSNNELCSFPLKMNRHVGFLPPADRAAAIHFSSDSIILQSHLLHIHKHVRGTHATRLWGCYKHQILSVRACHQRISPLDDIMSPLLAHHAPSRPLPHTVCYTTCQNPSLAHNLMFFYLCIIWPSWARFRGGWIHLLGQSQRND